jgi:hypothetical protein
MRVASAAHGNVKRWPRATRIRECCAKSNILDEALRSINILNSTLWITPPHAITVGLNFSGKVHFAILSK